MTHPRPGGQYPFPGPPQKRSNTGLVIGIVVAVAVLIVLIGGAVVLFTRSDSDGDDKASSKQEQEQPKRTKDNQKTKSEEDEQKLDTPPVSKFGISAAGTLLNHDAVAQAMGASRVVPKEKPAANANGLGTTYTCKFSSSSKNSALAVTVYDQISAAAAGFNATEFLNEVVADEAQSRPAASNWNATAISVDEDGVLSIDVASIIDDTLVFAAFAIGGNPSDEVLINLINDVLAHIQPLPSA